MNDILHREFVYVWYYFALQFRQIFQYYALGIELGSAIKHVVFYLIFSYGLFVCDGNGCQFSSLDHFSEFLCFHPPKGVKTR